MSTFEPSRLDATREPDPPSPGKTSEGMPLSVVALYALPFSSLSPL